MSDTTNTPKPSRAREPMKRAHHDISMRLPEGKTCGHCLHFPRCNAMFGHIEDDEVCDWSPSRFVALT